MLRIVQAVWSAPDLEACGSIWPLSGPKVVSACAFGICLLFCVTQHSECTDCILTLQATLTESHSLVLLATSGDNPVGCVIAWLLEDELQLLDIAIIPSCRRQGYGKYLLKALMSEAKSRGGTVMTLEVSRNNYAAVQMYHQMGCQQVHIRKDYYKDGSDALLMNKSL